MKHSKMLSIILTAALVLTIVLENAGQSFAAQTETTADETTNLTITAELGTAEKPVNDGVWSTDANGKQVYLRNGKPLCNTWAYLVNKEAKDGQPTFSKYLFGEDGTMLTGWQMVNNVWCYLNEVAIGHVGAYVSDAVKDAEKKSVTRTYTDSDDDDDDTTAAASAKVQPVTATIAAVAAVPASEANEAEAPAVSTDEAEVPADDNSVNKQTEEAEVPADNEEEKSAGDDSVNKQTEEAEAPADDDNEAPADDDSVNGQTKEAEAPANDDSEKPAGDDSVNGQTKEAEAPANDDSEKPAGDDSVNGQTSDAEAPADPADNEEENSADKTASDATDTVPTPVMTRGGWGGPGAGGWGGSGASTETTNDAETNDAEETGTTTNNANALTLDATFICRAYGCTMSDAAGLTCEYKMVDGVYYLIVYENDAVFISTSETELPDIIRAELTAMMACAQ